MQKYNLLNILVKLETVCCSKLRRSCKTCKEQTDYVDPSHVTLPDPCSALRPLELQYYNRITRAAVSFCCSRNFQTELMFSIDTNREVEYCTCSLQTLKCH